MSYNFIKSIYTKAEGNSAHSWPSSPSNGDTASANSNGFTFDSSRSDFVQNESPVQGRWVLNSGTTQSFNNGPTYLWDGHKWTASNVPDSSDVVQTTDTPAQGEALHWNNGVAVWSDIEVVEDTSPQLGGPLDAQSNKITSLGTPTASADAATKGYVDDNFVADAGGTMSGDLAMGNNKITGLGAPTADTDASTKKYVDDEIAGLVDSSPAALDTLNELAAAINDDANFSTTVTNSIATKLPLAGGTMTGNIVMSGTETVDGRDLSVDGAKLDLIEAGATADQTASEIKTLYESNSDTNEFSDAEQSKLAGIAAGAEVNVDTNLSATTAQDKITVESSTGTDVDLPLATLSTGTNKAGLFSPAEKTKLNNLPATVASSITDLSDVDTSSVGNTPSNGDGLVWNSTDSEWQPGQLSQQNADWTATSGVTQILNKPSLATVATSGNYSDLSGTPSLATVATSGSYNDLSGKPTIPTNNNQLTNGAGYTTFAEPGIFRNGGNPTLASGVTAGEVRTLIGAGTSSFSGSYNDLTSKPTIPTNNNQLSNGAGYISSFDITTQTDNKYVRSDQGDQKTGTLDIRSGELLVQTGGNNTYGVIKGYNNNNHFLGIRCSVANQSSLSITAANKTSFVEYASNDDTTGWFWLSSANNYGEVMRLTRGGGLHIAGDISLTGNATTSNQARTIDFTGFDKEGTTDFSDRAYIQHTTNTGGHSGSVLVISSQNDSSDGIAFQTHGSSKLKHNGNNILTTADEGSGNGLDADLLDGVQAWSFLRSDANDTLSAIITGHASDTEVLRVRSSSYSDRYLYLGGWSSANSNNISRIRSSTNLHIDSPANGDLYLNHYSNTAVRTGDGDLISDGNFYLNKELNMTLGGSKNRYIDADLGSNYLYIRGTSGGDANHITMASFKRNGAVALSYNGTTRISTASDGAVVDSVLTVNSRVQTDEIRCKTGAQIRINVGESAGKYNPTDETCSIIAETGLRVTCPDRAHGNWDSGYSLKHGLWTGDKLSVGYNGVPTGNLADASRPAIVMGDSDTGFRWLQDGIFDVYCNNQAQVRFQTSGTTIYDNLTVTGTVNAKTVLADDVLYSTLSGSTPTWTGIPSTATRIVVGFRNVSHSTADELMICLGNGSVQETNYESGSANQTGSSRKYDTTGFMIETTSTTSLLNGMMIIERCSTTSRTWYSHHNFAYGTSAALRHGSGTFFCNDTSVDRIRLSNEAKTGSFDAGLITIWCE